MPEVRQGVRVYTLTLLVLILCIAPTMWPQHSARHAPTEETMEVRMARIEERQIADSAAWARIEAKVDAQNTMVIAGLGALALASLGWLWARRK